MITTLTIHRKSGDLEVGVNQGSIRRYSLMSQDFIKLKFSLATNIPLLIGDYVDLTQYINECDNENFHVAVDGETGELEDETTKLFVINRNYYPTYNKNTGGWDYDVQIDAYYKQWNNYILMYDHDSGMSEASFSLTDTIDKHATLIINNLKSLGITYKGTEFGWEIQPDEMAKGMRFISYGAVTIYGALELIAQTFECEWWLDGGSTIHFGVRKGKNKPIELKLNEEIADASTSDSESIHATRLYAFGGSTNVPEHYRDILDFKASVIGKDYVYANNPVYPYMFTGAEDAATQLYECDGKRTDSTSLLRGVETVKSHTLEIRKFNLRAQSYRCKLEDFFPQLYFRKLLTRGERTDDFSINFTLGVRLKSADGNDVIEKTFNNKTIKSKISNLVTYSKELTKLKGLKGIIYYLEEKGWGNIVTTNGKNEWIDGYNITENTCIGATTLLGDKYDNLAPFWRPYEGDEYKDLYPDKMMHNVKYSPLTKYGAYTKNSSYSIFLGDYPTSEKLAVWSGKDQKSNSCVVYNSDSPANMLITPTKYIDWYFTPKQSGEYTLEFFIEATEATNVATMGGEYILVYDVSVPAFKMTLDRPDAKSVKTTLSYNDSNGDVQEAEVTINPDNYQCEENGENPIRQYNSSRIRFNSGTCPLTGNEIFNFKKILRSRVPGAYFTPRTSGVTNAVVQKNIMLPEGTNYVEPEGREDELDESNVVEAIIVYDWIYPKTEMTIYGVYDSTIKDDEGNETDTYSFKIKLGNFEWDKMVVGENLHVIFQTGSATGLMGFKFELNFVSTDNDFTTFQIVPNEDYGASLPNKNKKPAELDKIILEGIDIQYFDMGAIEETERLVLEQAKKDVEKTAKEDKVVDITLRSDDAYNRGRMALGSLVSLVNILSSEEDGKYDSRIIGYEEKLDIPYDSPKYIIGESNYYSTIGAIEGKLLEIDKGSISLGAGGGGGGAQPIKIIKLDENTKPTDANVFSALRVDERFLHTKGDDVADGNITFNKNISVGETVTAKQLDVKGNANVGGSMNVEVNHTVVGEQRVYGLQTLHTGFTTPNFNEAGGQIVGAHLTANGVMTLAGLKAMSFEVFELVYNKVRAQGGKFAFSNAANIEYCEYEMVDGQMIEPDEYEDWKEEIKTNERYEEFRSQWPITNDGLDEWDWIGGILSVTLTIKKDDVNTAVPFVNGDIIYGYVNQIGESGQYAKGGQCVMHIVSPDEEIGKDGSMSIRAELFRMGDISKNEGVVISNIPPTNGMAVAQRGNKTREDRTTSFFIDTETANIYQLSNVTTPTLDYEHYATVIGKLPFDLWRKVYAEYSFVKETDPVVYAKYGIFDNVLQFDHQGKAIKRENNRGEWDRSIATNENKSLRYKNEATYYDVVTYKGELWKCSENDTEDVPGYGKGWLKLVARGTSLVYEFRVSPSSILVTGDNEFSANEIEVAITESSADGFAVLTSQSQLEEKNLKVQYSFNGNTRLDYIVMPAGVIGLEDGSGILSTEDDMAITFETKGLPLSTEYKSLTLYLVDTVSGEDRQQLDIPIVRNGSDGKPFEATNIFKNANFELYESDTVTLKDWGMVNNMYHTVANNVLGAYNAILSASYFKGLLMRQSINFGYGQTTVLSFKCNQQTQYSAFVAVKAVNQSNVLLEPYDKSTSAHRAYDSDLGKGYYISSKLNTFDQCAFRLVVYSGESVTISFGSAGIADFYIATPQIELGTEITPFSKSPTELTGPAGQTGASIYPSGTWDENQVYRKELNCIPFVWYQRSDDVQGHYYVLKKDVSVGSAPDRSEDWDVFESVKYMYAEFLMANEAHFGNDKGAVFYDKYLYSQYGVYKDGSYAQCPKAGLMFDDDMNLTDACTPSLFMNFYDGELKVNKLSETYQEFDYYSAAKEIKHGESYNIKVTMNDTEGGANAKLLCMPQSRDLYISDNGEEIVIQPKQAWEPDGMRSSVLVKALRNWERRMRATLEKWSADYVTKFTTVADAASHCVLLCGDARYFNPLNFYLDGDYVKNRAMEDNNDGMGAFETGTFVIGGVFTDFILVEPGQNVVMRSCEESVSMTGIGTRTLWYVENAEDFIEVPFTIRYEIYNYMDNEGVIQHLESPKYYPYGYANSGYGYKVRTFVSKSLYSLYSKLSNNTICIDVESINTKIMYDDEYDWTSTIKQLACRTSHEIV